MRPSMIFMRYPLSPTSSMNVVLRKRPRRTRLASEFTKSAILSIMTLSSPRACPGSAAHHHSASKTRVNGLMEVLRCARDTRLSSHSHQRIDGDDAFALGANDQRIDLGLADRRSI